MTKTKSVRTPFKARNAAAVTRLCRADNGWAGVGYNNPNLHTPQLDALCGGGLKLTSHYVCACHPTTAAAVE